MNYEKTMENTEQTSPSIINVYPVRRVPTFLELANRLGVSIFDLFSREGALRLYNTPLFYCTITAKYVEEGLLNPDLTFNEDFDW